VTNTGRTFACYPTTRRMMEGILAVEEQHADELAGLLETLPEESEGKRRSKRSK
jgi:bacterioferritin (cytochrome b1)